MLGKFRSYFRQKTVFQTKSNENSLLEVVRSGNNLILNGLNVNYSFGSLHRLFQRILDDVQIKKRQPRKVLILGFGAGSVAAILNVELNLKCQITGIEKDPEVISIRNTFFETFNDPLINVIEDDACSYVSNHIDTYDLIVVDVYNDFNVPKCCQTENFLTKLRLLLNAGGVILFNKILYNPDTKVEAKSLDQKFKKVFEEYRVIKVRKKLTNWVFVYESPDQIVK